MIDDPEDDAPRARPRVRARPGSGGDEEVIEDPEDSPPRRRAVSKGPATKTPSAFTPRILVGGLVHLWAGFDVRYEGRRRELSTDTRATEDVFELMTRARLHVESRFRRWAKVRLGARLDHWVSCERPSQDDVLWLGNGEAWTTRAEVELGEAYVDLYFGKFDFRIGQQVVSWGLNELINPNDVVNPRDLRRGLFAFDDDLRLPVPAIRASLHWRWLKVEAIWLPLFRSHRMDIYGSDFALLGPGSSSRLAEAEHHIERFVDPTLRSQAQALLMQTRLPRDDLSASSAGLRMAVSHQGWDIALQYLFGWDRTPALTVNENLYRAALEGRLFVNGNLNAAALLPLLGGEPVYTSTYERGHQVGLSLGKAFEHLALRLDVSYEPQRGFVRTDPAPETSEDTIDLRVTHHTLISALSVEYAHGSLVMVQLQGLHLALLDRDRDDARELMGFLRQSHVALLVALVRLQLLRETLIITLAGAVDLLHASVTITPAIHYKVTDAWRIGIGAMVFEGKSDTLFGAWGQNDLVWLDVKWSF